MSSDLRFAVAGGAGAGSGCVAGGSLQAHQAPHRAVVHRHRRPYPTSACASRRRRRRRGLRPGHGPRERAGAAGADKASALRRSTTRSRVAQRRARRAHRRRRRAGREQQVRQRRQGAAVLQRHAESLIAAQPGHHCRQPAAAAAAATATAGPGPCGGEGAQQPARPAAF
jgi:hypothetical protein